ncbi:methylated-DNA--protein-cysteine methyltransferase [Oscillospiraceae bacterium]|nr:methylated-DNA--protein-cysteine methyltransferase [Oscillospiraceae bacterium]BDF76821.1 methylated-DNA--protein-cysteine methyltransferase [Oscillospiraceae bacterium]
MSYYERVYALVAQIPAGRVATYGQLALMTGSPRAARAVGYAMRACKDEALPCHRVLHADGATTCAFGEGVQRALLEAEGVPFTADGRADLSLCRWDGR